MPLFNDMKSAIVNHPGFVSGKYYASCSYSTLSNSTLGSGTCYYTYFFIPTDKNFDSVAFILSATNAIQKARIAIYTIANGLPASLVKDFGEITLNIAGGREILNSTFLAAGWYAVAVSTNSAAASFLFPSVNLSTYIGLPSINSNNFNGLSVALTYPSSYSALAAVSGIISATNCPLILLKAG